MLQQLLEGIAAFIENASMGDPIKAAFLLSMYAAIMTSLGGLTALLANIASDRSKLDVVLDVGMGFSSGVMIVASFTSLLLPALEFSGAGIVLLSFVAGAIFIYIINAAVPHEHFIKGYEGPSSLKRKVKAAWLVATAIIIHNLPEGMAIGASTVYNLREGLIVALAIGTQDFPEGLAVALPVFAVTGGFAIALVVAVFSGLTEVFAALLMAVFLGFNPDLLAAALSFAAGAMVFVVSYEALPESHRSGHEKLATVGFFIGFIIMLYLDVTLG